VHRPSDLAFPPRSSRACQIPQPAPTFSHRSFDGLPNLRRRVAASAACRSCGHTLSASAGCRSSGRPSKLRQSVVSFGSSPKLRQSIVGFGRLPKLRQRVVSFGSPPKLRRAVVSFGSSLLASAGRCKLRQNFCGIFRRNGQAAGVTFRRNCLHSEGGLLAYPASGKSDSNPTPSRIQR